MTIHVANGRLYIDKPTDEVEAAYVKLMNSRANGLEFNISSRKQGWPAIPTVMVEDGVAGRYKTENATTAWVVPAKGSGYSLAYIPPRGNVFIDYNDTPLSDQSVVALFGLRE